MEGQLLIAQLAVLLEERAAQYRFGRQPGGLDATSTQISHHQTKQVTMLIQPPDIAFNSWPISCVAKRSNTLAWTVRSWRIVGSGGSRPLESVG
jgi:hypothetical protein